MLVAHFYCVCIHAPTVLLFQPISFRLCANRQFIDNLPDGHLYELDEIIDQHTLLPFYGSFISSDKRINLRMKMAEEDSKVSSLIFGFNRNIAMSFYFRYCPECVKEDRKRLGECYWHRLHQTPGIEVCTSHNVFLVQSNIPIRGESYQPDFIAAESIDMTTSSVKIDPFNKVHMEFERLAKNIFFLYQGSLPPITHQLTCSWYLKQLEKLDLLINSRGKSKTSKLKPVFQKYYTKTFLSHLGCELYRFTSSDWLNTLITNSSHQSSPIHHVLMIQFLGMTLEEFFDIIDNDPYDGKHENTSD